MKFNTTRFKDRLLEEKIRLEEDLARVGRRSPSNPSDWEPRFTSMNEERSSTDEVADKFEEMEQTLALQTTYENRLRAVEAALNRIEEGIYGTCPECGNVISPERLEADPTASCACKEEGAA